MKMKYFYSIKFFNFISWVAFGALCLSALWYLTNLQAKPKIEQASDDANLSTLFVKLASDTKRDSLVFVLQEDCQYCEQSSPFYRGLLRAIKSTPAISARLATVALFPENASDPLLYLHARNLYPEQASKANLRVLHIDGTPTILLLSPDGLIKKRWSGSLDEQGQTDLIQTLGLEAVVAVGSAQDRAPQVVRIAKSANVAYSATKSKAIILDVRDRRYFQARSWPNSINIPVDELEIRAPIEINPDSVIYVQHLLPAGECKIRPDNPQNASDISTGEAVASYFSKVFPATTVTLIDGQPLP